MGNALFVLLAGRLNRVKVCRMKLTPKKRRELLEAAKPLIKWMAENCHPHCIARVNQVSVELLVSVASRRTQEFLKD